MQRLFFAIWVNFIYYKSTIHPLRVKNIDSNSRLVVNEDSNCKFRVKWVNNTAIQRLHDALKPRFTPLKSYLFFFTANSFRRQISMKLFYEYTVIFFNLSPISNHLHPPQVENCDSNSRLVVDEEDYGKFRLKRVNWKIQVFYYAYRVRITLPLWQGAERMNDVLNCHIACLALPILSDCPTRHFACQYIT